MDALWLAVVVGGVGCILLLSRRWFTFSKLPPGPRGWPLVGNAFQQDPMRPHIMWSKWAEKYGDTFTLNLLGTPIVVCNSFEAIWEMLVSKSSDFAGRPPSFHLRYMKDNGVDVINSDFGPQWAYVKKILSTSIKMHGDGLERLENIMSDIVVDIVEDFQKTKQQPFDPLGSIHLALCNTLAMMLLGERFDYKDPDFQQLLYHVKQSDVIFAPCLEFILLSSFPWLRHIPLNYCKLMTDYNKSFLRDWVPRMIQNRMDQFDESNPSCILDAFIKQNETDMKTKPQYPFNKGQMILLCENIFIAGMLTSTSTLYTIMAILTAKQDVQDKLRAEVDQVLGGRRPKLQDKQAMPYYLAVLEEVLRYAVIVNGLPHQTTVNTSICGHNVPKDTQVWANVWHLCHDPSLWGDPWTFRPERFLDETGGFVPADHPARKRVMVFGAGRRVCPGELLARNRIFLIITSLLQNFMIKPAADDQLPECDPRTYPPGIVFKPKSFKIRAIPRE